jgi:uncharacterized repeat protein (TIGR01451 family)
MEVAEMISVRRTLIRATQVALMLAAMTAAKQTFAAGTASGIAVNNRATIEYQVGGVTQEVIESSPTGNSSPGVSAGADTSFVVDNLVDFSVTEVGASSTPVGPGQSNAVTTFRVDNSGNTSQGFALTAANLTGGTVFDLDTIDVGNIRWFVDSNGDSVYDPGLDTATVIDTLAADGTVTVFVVVDVPLASGNGSAGNVSLTAVVHAAGTNATSPMVASSGADTAAVDVVFADSGNDGIEADFDGYLVESASLSIQKTSSVVRDPVTGAVEPKAIPGAIVEYAVTITNAGSADATNLVVRDTLVGSLLLTLGEYSSEDVQIEFGTPAAVSTCTADNLDGDGDGCGFTGGELIVDLAPFVIGTTPADDQIRVLFRAEID